MSEATARFALPFILPGQAQKEVFHNEALTRIDMALSPTIQGPPAGTPPSDPAEGQSWIVSDSPSGAWTGKNNQVAMWTAGGWRFLLPPPGTMAWDASQELWLHFDGAGWSDGALPASSIRIGGLKVLGERQPDVPNPSGGTIIDIEARAALVAITAALKSHGLIG